MIDSKTSKVFRGIAILMVIASHYAAAMYVEPLRPVAKDFISKLGVYGVDIFFMLSGYGLVKSTQKSGITKRFVLKRFINSYVPYILIVGFFAIIEKSITDTKSFVSLITGMDYWFMNVIFILYIMFMIIYRIDKFKELLITIAVIGYTYWMYSVGRADFWELSNGAFLVGIYAASLEGKFGDKVKTWFNKTNLTVIAFAVMSAAWFIYSGDPQMWSHMVVSMSFTVFALGCCINFQAGGVILSAIGRYSLYIYLLHLRLFWKIVMMHTEWPYAKNAILTAMISLVIAVAVGFAIEWNLNNLIKIKDK